MSVIDFEFTSGIVLQPSRSMLLKFDVQVDSMSYDIAVIGESIYVDVTQVAVDGITLDIEGAVFGTVSIYSGDDETRLINMAAVIVYAKMTDACKPYISILEEIFQAAITKYTSNFDDIQMQVDSLVDNENRDDKSICPPASALKH